MSKLFDLSQPRVNYWIHRLLPVLRLALDDLGVLPERDATHFAQAHGASGKAPRLIIDATERRTWFLFEANREPDTSGH